MRRLPEDAPRRLRTWTWTWTWTWTRLVACGLSTLAGAACMTQGPRAYPLYPDPEHPRPDAEVGLLEAPVAIIDGQEVFDKGRIFALLPGCHSFKLLRSIGENGVGTGIGYRATLPQRQFTLDVRPGHSYSFDSSVGPFVAATGSWRWGFSDRPGDGSITAAHECNGAALPALSELLVTVKRSN
jgi:hypothetical protein